MKYSFLKILISLIVILFVSCGDIDSIHEQYLQGEQVYAGKLDTLEIRPGYYRAQLEGQTQFLGNSNQIIIEYDDITDVYNIEQNNIENGIYKMILPNLDEKSYIGGEHPDYHPITWYHEYDGGRSFYTGLGHTKEVYEDSRFMKLLEKGILYASFEEY